MSSPNQIFSKATVSVDGQRLPVKQGTVEVTPGYGERNAEMGEYGPEGFSEKATAYMLKCTVFAKGGITAAKLWAFIDKTVQVEGDNGLTYDLVQTTTLKVGPIKTGEGAGWELEMFAMRGNESVS